MAKHGVQVIGWGLVYLTVCAPEDTDTAVLEAEANRQYPTGISSPWAISDDEKFSGGQPNPCSCDRVEGRRHSKLSC